MMLSYNKHEEEEEDFDLKSRHSCTDVPCCVLFLVALAAFGALYRFALAKGDIGKLYHGIDYDGRVCGVDAQVADRPYLYWCATASADGEGLKFNTGKPICVEHCPDGSFMSPIYDVQPECALVSGSLSQMMPYQTIVLLDRYCIPDTTQDKGASQQITSQLNTLGTNAQEALSSLPSAWPVLLGTFFVAIVLGYAYLVMLRHCAEPLIWLSIVASVGGLIVFGIYLWTNAGHLLEQVEADSDLGKDLQQLKGHEEDATKIAAIVCFGLAGLLAFVANCLHHSIHVAAAVVEVACEAIFDMPSLLLAPILKVLVKGGAFLGLVFGFLMLYSSSEMTTGEDGVIRQFSTTGDQKYMLLGYAFMSIWILAFLNALYQFIVGYAIVEYYYTPYDRTSGHKDVGCCAVCDGLQVGLMYHAGSLAYGSLLIALLTMLQKLIEYAEEKNKEAGNNRVIAAILCVVECLVACCKDLVKRVNRTAYIDIAITSNDFCSAAQEALATMAAMVANLGILTGATFVFSVFGVIIITLGCAGFAYTVSNGGEYSDHSSQFHIDSPVAVTWVAAFIGVLVSASFMNVFDVAADALLYCFQLDRSSGKGCQTAPAALQELMHGAN